MFGFITVSQLQRKMKRSFQLEFSYSSTQEIYWSRNPLVSFLYERGWRQNFIWGGFPGPEKEVMWCSLVLLMHWCLERKILNWFIYAYVLWTQDMCICVSHIHRGYKKKKKNCCVSVYHTYRVGYKKNWSKNLRKRLKRMDGQIKRKKRKKKSNLSKREKRLDHIYSCIWSPCNLY